MNLEINNLLPFIVNCPLFIALLLLIIRHKLTSYIITTLTTFGVLLLSIVIMLNINIADSLHYFFGNFLPPFGIEYKIDTLNLFFIVLVSLVGFVVSIYNFKTTLVDINTNKYFLFNSLFLLCFSGLLGILITNDAFNLFVFLEISSLSTYILISMNEKKQALIASFNYLIIGSISASFYVFGIGILYAFFGTLNISTLSHSIMYASEINNTLIVGALFIIVGILIKVALFPLFLWSPNAYTFAPNSVSAFLAGVSGKVALYMFIKIVLIMLSLNSLFNIDNLLNLLQILAICSMFVGGYLAFMQNNLKKLLAFSSLAQVGFIVFALSLNSVEGFAVALFLIFSHALIKLGLFLLVGILNIKFNTVLLNQLQGLSKNSKLEFILIVFFMLSLASIPGTSMFIAKFNLILVSLKTNYLYAVLISLASVLSFLYSFKVIYLLWYKPKEHTNESTLSVKKAPTYAIVAVFVVFIVNIALICYPNFLITISNYIAFSNIK